MRWKMERRSDGLTGGAGPRDESRDLSWLATMRREGNLSSTGERGTKDKNIRNLSV